MKAARTVTIIVALLALSAPLAAADKPATAPAKTPAQRLAPFLKVIRASDDARTVMRTYTRALGVDRDNVELHKLYVRRMLKFGLPQIARHAARELVRMDKADGLAWALMGYIHGKHGDLAEAFVATMRALEELPNDPSVRNNAGQLVAWYDFEAPPPRLPDPARRTLARLRKPLAQTQEFDRAYKALQAAYSQQGLEARALAQKMVAAETEAQAVQTLARDVNDRLAGLNDEIDTRQRRIDSYWRDIRYGYSYFAYPYYGGYRRSSYSYSYYYRADLHARILDEQRELDRLRASLAQVRREGQAVLAELARKEAALKALRDRVRQAVNRVAREFRWDPPAVEGVVTAERDKIPPTVGQPKLKVPVDPHTDAAQILELAKLYLRHNMSERALGLLEMVVKKYPKTKAGVQADILLRALKPIE